MNVKKMGEVLMPDRWYQIINVSEIVAIIKRRKKRRKKENNYTRYFIACVLYDTSSPKTKMRYVFGAVFVH